MTLVEIVLGTGVVGLLAKELISWAFNRRKKRAEAQASEAAANASEIKNESSEIDNAFKAATMWRENAEAFQEQLQRVQSDYSNNLKLTEGLTKKMDELTLLTQRQTKEIAELTLITQKQTKEIVKLETKVQTLTRENRELISKLTT